MLVVDFGKTSVKLEYNDPSIWMAYTETAFVKEVTTRKYLRKVHTYALYASSKAKSCGLTIDSI